MGKKTRKKKGSSSPPSTLTSTVKKPACYVAWWSRQKLTVASLLVLSTSIFIAYGNTIQNGFVYDDRYEILQNSYIKSPQNWYKIFTTPSWSFMSNPEAQWSSNYYRPVQYLFHGIIYYFVGPSAASFHLFKILLHLLVSVLFFVVVLNLTGQESAAFLASLLFALHPANSEAVAWISATPDVCSAIFFLLCLWNFLKLSEHDHWLNWAGLQVFFFLGMFSKETMVTFIGVAFLFSWLKTNRLPGWHVLLRIYVPLVLIFILYVAMRIKAIGGFSYASQANWPELGLIQGVWNWMTLYARYLWKFLAPIDLKAAYSFVPVQSLAEWQIPAALATLGGMAGAFWYGWKRLLVEQRSILGIGLAWFTLGLSPVLFFYKRIGESVFAERYLYLPALGLCLIAGLLLSHLYESRPKLLTMLLVVLCILFAARILVRNRDWKDDLTFYKKTVQSTPRAADIWVALGNVYYARNQMDEARHAFESAHRIKPTFASTANLAMISGAQHRYPEAIQFYRAAIEMQPKTSFFYSNLGEIFFILNRIPEAVEAFEKACQNNPSDTRAHFNLADAYLEQKKFLEAARSFEIAARLAPQLASRAYLGMAQAYQTLGMKAEAEAAMARYQQSMTSNR